MSDNYFAKFLELIKPESDFNNTEIPPAPDYSDINCWAAAPNIEGQQFYVPDSSFVAIKDNDVDVFYIHPTGYYEKTWNSNMDKNRSAFERTEIMLVIKLLLLMAHVTFMHPNIDRLRITHFLIKMIVAERLLI